MVTALYRRYRPETFAELIGQSQVTDPLRTALRTDRVNHAYLFSGPRGCGKTTSARILARCLNCAEGPTDTPCGVCPSCVELARDGGGSLDVVEIDAASHNGVDDARDLRERAAFAPARDRYKIFILDEAHMVTTQGFNALLKLVEEPPEHVKFIFATTEPEKVIGTIRSRTHHYPFRLVPPAQMLDYVQQLCVAEKVEVEGGVLPLVVRAGGGSVRDTLSLLDQLIAGSEGSTIDYERAVALLGYTHGALLDEVVDAIAARDAGAVFGAVDRVVQTGQDPRRFVEDLLERLRDLIVVAATRDGASAVLRGVPLDEIDRMSTQASAFGAAELSRAADVVNTALTEMTGATSPRLHLELMVARLLVPAADETERGALARVERLERRMGIDEHPSMRAVPDRPAVEPVDIRTARKARDEAAPAATPSRVEEGVADGDSRLRAASKPEHPRTSGRPDATRRPVELEPVDVATTRILRHPAADPGCLARSARNRQEVEAHVVDGALHLDPPCLHRRCVDGGLPERGRRRLIPAAAGTGRERERAAARRDPRGARRAGQVPHPPRSLRRRPEAHRRARARADRQRPRRASGAVNPLPPAAEWNVVTIPGQAAPEPAIVTPNTATVAPPTTDAGSPAKATPASTPAVSSPPAEKPAPKQHTADGKARYGEAVVREILGAKLHRRALARSD